MNRILHLVLLSLCGVMGAGAESGALSLDQAVQEALSNNASLTALTHTRGALAERPAQVSGLPNPMFTYRGMDAPDGGSFPNTAEKRFEIEQSLPGFGKRGLREAVARNEAETMGAEADAMAREVVLMVKETGFELQAVQKALGITRDEAGILSRMAKAAEARYAVGEAVQADVIKAQTELTMLKQKRLELEGREKALTSRLAFLMNRSPDRPVGRIAAFVPDDAVPDPVSRVKVALANRAEIKAAQLKVDRSELQRRLMSRESQPDYKVGLEYRAIEHGNDMVMFMAGVDLPLWQGKNRAAIREAAMMAAASEAEREGVERQVAQAVQQACYKVETAKRTLGLYRNELIPQAAVRFKSSEAGYRVGKVDFSDWLESERFALDARIMAVMAEGELGASWAALERAMGGSL